VRGVVSPVEHKKGDGSDGCKLLHCGPKAKAEGRAGGRVDAEALPGTVVATRKHGRAESARRQGEEIIVRP